MTDRRVYHVELKSVAGTAMAAVSWRYPVDMMLANTAPPPAVAPPRRQHSSRRSSIFATASTAISLTGVHSPPSTMASRCSSRCPRRLVRWKRLPCSCSGDDGAELVNYRVVGKYYVVDRLFTKAELRLGTGWGQKKVQIYRQTPLSGGAHG
jgi:hypothetical protein